MSFCNEGAKDAAKILKLYDCLNAATFSQIFINSGMSHGVGLMEAKVKVADDCCLVLQVQGNRYCHGIERKNIAKSIISLSKWSQDFINFKFGGLNNHFHEADSKLCHYSDGFVYKSQTIDSCIVVRNVIDALKIDIDIILKTKPINIYSK